MKAYPIAITLEALQQANKEFTNVPASTLLEIYSALFVFVFMFLEVFVL